MRTIDPAEENRDQDNESESGQHGGSGAHKSDECGAELKRKKSRDTSGREYASRIEEDGGCRDKDDGCDDDPKRSKAGHGLKRDPLDVEVLKIGPPPTD